MDVHDRKERALAPEMRLIEEKRGSRDLSDDACRKVSKSATESLEEVD